MVTEKLLASTLAQADELIAAGRPGWPAGRLCADGHPEAGVGDGGPPAGRGCHREGGVRPGAVPPRWPRRHGVARRPDLVVRQGAPGRCSTWASTGSTGSLRCSAPHRAAAAMRGDRRRCGGNRAARLAAWRPGPRQQARCWTSATPGSPWCAGLRDGHAQPGDGGVRSWRHHGQLRRTAPAPRLRGAAAATRRSNRPGYRTPRPGQTRSRSIPARPDHILERCDQAPPPRTEGGAPMKKKVLERVCLAAAGTWPTAWSSRGRPRLKRPGQASVATAAKRMSSLGQRDARASGLSSHHHPIPGGGGRLGEGPRAGQRW